MRWRALALLALLAGGLIAGKTGEEPAVRTVVLEQSPMSVVVDRRTGRALLATSDASNANRVSVLDTTTGALLGTVQLGGGLMLPSVAVDERSGRAFVVDGNANRVSLLDDHTGGLLRTVRVGRSPGSVAVDERAGRVFVLSTVDASVSMLDARAGAVVRTIAMGAIPSCVAVDERRGRAFIGTYGGTVRVIDTRTGAIVRTSQVTGWVAALGVDERAGRVVATGYSTGYTPRSVTGALGVLDAETGRPLRTVPMGLDPSNLVVDGRVGRAFVIDQLTNMIGVFATRTGRLVRTVALTQAPALLSVDGQTGRAFVIGQDSDTVAVLDAHSGVVRRTLTMDRHPAAFTWADGIAVDEAHRRVLVATDNGATARVVMLDAHTGRVLTVMPLQVFPSAVALDERTGRVVVVGIPLPSLNVVAVLEAYVTDAIRSVLSHLGLQSPPSLLNLSPPANKAGGVSLIDVSRYLGFQRSAGLIADGCYSPLPAIQQTRRGRRCGRYGPAGSRRSQPTQPVAQRPLCDTTSTAHSRANHLDRRSQIVVARPACPH